MLDIVKLITFTLILLITINSIVKIIKGYGNLILFINIVFFVVMVIPVGLDLIKGAPNYLYSLHYGFIISNSDVLTSYIYCLYLLICTAIFNTLIKNKLYKVDYKVYLKNTKLLKLILNICIFSPIVLIWRLPDPKLLLKYGYLGTNIGLMGEEWIKSFNTLFLFTLLSVVSSYIILIIDNKINVIKIMIIFNMIIFCNYINGKRLIVLISLALLMYLMWYKGIARNIKFIFCVVIITLLFLGFNNIYKYNEYTYEKFEGIDKYLSYRIEYGRDDVTKMAIYSQLYPDKMQILEYKGQSALFNILFFMPRSIWENKPYPYAVYVTSALLNIYPQDVGWQMTTGILDETISNLGWVGMLIGPLIIRFICLKGDKSRNILFKLLTLIIASLMMVLQVSAFMPIFMVWVGVIVLEKIMFNKLK